jgi:acyl-CoA thioesterase-1
MKRILKYAACAAAILWTAGVGHADDIPDPDAPIVIFAFGDSLTSGYGLPAKDAFPVKLQTALRAKGWNVTVVNGGVGGDTSAYGLSRLDWSLPKHTDAAIVEFGANDAFTGVFPSVMRSNLETIVKKLQAKGIEVMLSGMMAPRNLGKVYYDDFDASYAEIAEKYNCILYPFYLDGVVMNRKLNQADQLHPNAEGVDVIVSRITPTVEKLIDRVVASRKEHIIHTAQ